MRTDPLRMWAHRLAEHLGMTVADVMDRVSVDEMRDWQAYFAIQREPTR